jgi:hypothetical protein
MGPCGYNADPLVQECHTCGGATVEGRVLLGAPGVLVEYRITNAEKGVFTGRSVRAVLQPSTAVGLFRRGFLMVRDHDAGHQRFVLLFGSSARGESLADAGWWFRTAVRIGPAWATWLPTPAAVSNFRGMFARK